jgi:hypothetical protein
LILREPFPISVSETQQAAIARLAGRSIQTSIRLARERPHNDDIGRAA